MRPIPTAGGSGPAEPGRIGPREPGRICLPEPGEAGVEATGVRFADAAPLISAALALLQESPRPASVLARRVLGVRQAPPGLGERLVEELLGRDPRVMVDAGGVWRLREQRAGRRASRLGSLRYAVVDVETTGRPPGRGGRVVEIAVVQVREGRVAGQFSTLVNPGVPVAPAVERLTGISDRMLAGAPPFDEIAGLVRRELEGRIFVAHNVAFDWGFVASEMRRARSLLPTGPRLCTRRLARRALPGLRRGSLDAVAGHYGLEIPGRHRAAGDASVTARLLLLLLAEAEMQGVERWDQLRRWLSGSTLGRRRPGGRAGRAERRGTGEERGGDAAPGGPGSRRC